MERFKSATWSAVEKGQLAEQLRPVARKNAPFSSSRSGAPSEMVLKAFSRTDSHSKPLATSNPDSERATSEARELTLREDFFALVIFCRFSSTFQAVFEHRRPVPKLDSCAIELLPPILRLLDSLELLLDSPQAAFERLSFERQRVEVF